MKSIQRFTVWLMVLTLGITLLAGCAKKPAPAPAPQAAPTAPTAPTPPTPVTVKVGNVSSLLFAPFYVAMEKGYFKDEAIEVKLENLQAGQDAMVFLANGQLDFVLAGYSAALFNFIGRDMDLKVIAPMGIQPQKGDPSPLMVRADLVASGQVKNAGDLRGKKFGITGGAGGTGSFLAALRLQKYGLTLADIQIVNLGLADQEAGLANKSVDVALMSEPYATKTIKDGVGTPVDAGMLAGVNASGLLTSGKMLKEQSDVVNRFTTALLRAARDLQGDGFRKEEHLTIFAKYTKLTPEVIREVVPYHFDPNFDLTAPKRDLAMMQDIFTKAGTLKLAKPLTIDQVVNDAPVAAAVKKLGRK